MDKIYLVQGDTHPQLVVTLTDDNTGLPIDLSDSGTSVVMKFRKAGSLTLTSTVPGYKLPGTVQPDGSVDMTNLTPGKGGRCYFKFGPTDLSAAGQYEGQFQITFSDGVQSVYDTIKFSVKQEF